MEALETIDDDCDDLGVSLVTIEAASLRSSNLGGQNDEEEEEEEDEEEEEEEETSAESAAALALSLGVKSLPALVYFAEQVGRAIGDYIARRAECVFFMQSVWNGVIIVIIDNILYTECVPVQYIVLG